MILVAESKPILQGYGRTIRNGRWFSSAFNCRASFRYWTSDTIYISCLGFRVILRKRIP